MGFVGTGKKGKRRGMILALLEEAIDRIHIRIPCTSLFSSGIGIFKREGLSGIDVGLATQGDSIARFLEVVGHTSDALSDKGVIGVGARSHRIKPCVERVAGGGTHGG